MISRVIGVLQTMIAKSELAQFGQTNMNFFKKAEKKIESKKEPIRILHYIKHLESGGGEILLYNIYQNIDRSKIQFDFLVNTSRKELLDDKVRALGGRKVVLLEREPRFTPVKIALVVRRLYKLLRSGEYKIFHIHCSNGQGLLYARIAELAGIPVRIIHIHNIAVEGKFVRLKKIFHNLCKILFMSAPTDNFACSHEAAKWLYSQEIVKNKNYTVIKNGINLEKFCFNEKKRNNLIGEDSAERKKLCIFQKEWERKKIIVSIGRLEKEKNQMFLLKIFNCICNDNDNYRLILIGRGSLEYEIKKYANKLGIANKILFVNHTDHVEEYLCISDIFILPSNSEGFGIVAIEAQAAGLKTIVSDRVSKEVFVSELITSISLDQSADKWAEYILRLSLDDCRSNNTHYIEEIRKNGFDIIEVSKKLENFYENKWKQINVEDIL